MNKIIYSKINKDPFDFIVINDFFSNFNTNDNYQSIINFFKSYDFILDIEEKFKLKPWSLIYNNYEIITSSPGSFISYNNHNNNKNILYIFLFLNENYNDNNGGQLHLLNSFSKTVEFIIKPEFNKLVIFTVSNNTIFGFNINKNNFFNKYLKVNYYY